MANSAKQAADPMAQPGRAPHSLGPRRTENLSRLFQEPFTVAARLRAHPQAVGSPQAFRQHVAAAVRGATQEAVRRAYPQKDAELAGFAVVALMDELVVKSGNGGFADWVRHPLHEEFYGTTLSSEGYFGKLDEILARPDSQDLADLLEVYQLAILLGFQGPPDPLNSVAHYREIITGRIQAIRATYPVISPYPAHAPSARTPDASRLWTRRLLWAAGGVAALAVVLFVTFKLVLLSGVLALKALVAGNPL
jgi:type IV/VI secretion system ImpK/VasF family protein